VQVREEEANRSVIVPPTGNTIGAVEKR